MVAELLNPRILSYSLLLSKSLSSKPWRLAQLAPVCKQAIAVQEMPNRRQQHSLPQAVVSRENKEDRSEPTSWMQHTMTPCHKRHSPSRRQMSTAAHRRQWE